MFIIHRTEDQKLFWVFFREEGGFTYLVKFLGRIKKDIILELKVLIVLSSFPRALKHV